MRTFITKFMEFLFKYSGPANERPEINEAGENKKFYEFFDKILINQIKIMAAIDDLKTQVNALQTQTADLQTALDAEQAQIQQLLDTNAAVVTDLNTQIANLQAQIAAGATPEQLQEVATALTNISSSLATTKTDLEGTVTP